MANSPIHKPFSKSDLIGGTTNTLFYGGQQLLAMQTKSGNTVYRLQLEASEGSLRLFKSTDNGANWAVVKQFYP